MENISGYTRTTLRSLSSATAAHIVNFGNTCNAHCFHALDVSYKQAIIIYLFIYLFVCIRIFLRVRGGHFTMLFAICTWKFACAAWS